MTSEIFEARAQGAVMGLCFAVEFARRMGQDPAVPEVGRNLLNAFATTIEQNLSKLGSDAVEAVEEVEKQP